MKDAFTERLRALGAEGEVVEFDTEMPTAAAAAGQLGCWAAGLRGRGDRQQPRVHRERRPLLVIASGAHRVDTGGLERSLGVRKIRRASPEFVAEATGQPVGGVGPVGHPQAIRTVVDRVLAAHPTVWERGPAASTRCSRRTSPSCCGSPADIAQS